MRQGSKALLMLDLEGVLVQSVNSRRKYKTFGKLNRVMQDQDKSKLI